MTTVIPIVLSLCLVAMVLINNTYRRFIKAQGRLFNAYRNASHVYITQLEFNVRIMRQVICNEIIPKLIEEERYEEVAKLKAILEKDAEEDRKGNPNSGYGEGGDVKSSQGGQN